MITINEQVTSIIEDHEYYAVVSTTHGNLLMTYEDIFNWMQRKVPVLVGFIYENNTYVEEVSIGAKTVLSLVEILKGQNS